MISRRQFLSAIGALAAVPVFVRSTQQQNDGRILARVRKPTKSIAPGEHALPLKRGRPTLLYVPPSYKTDVPAPIVVVLHGATGAGVNQLARYRAYAEQFGAVVLAPSSEGVTWDAIRGDFDADCLHIDAALDYVFDRCAIDATRVAIAGFSDGASYALSLGLINGQLFTHAVAFSPGFIIPGERARKPAIFIAHGTQDEILPIDRCGRPIARDLRAAGYAVDFREFNGGHQMLETMMPDAATFMRWKS
ncbi:MAG: phospholipase [Gemmatimonadota bacterium]